MVVVYQFLSHILGKTILEGEAVVFKNLMVVAEFLHEVDGAAVFLRDFLVGPSIHDILLTDFLLVKSGGDSVFVNPILIHEFSNPVIG